MYGSSDWKARRTIAEDKNPAENGMSRVLGIATSFVWEIKSPCLYKLPVYPKRGERFLSILIPHLSNCTSSVIK